MSDKESKDEKEVDEAEENTAAPEAVEKEPDIQEAAPPVAASEAPPAAAPVVAQNDTPPVEMPQAAAPVAAPVTAGVVTEELTPQQEAQQRTEQQMQFGDDLKYGKITPKTYSDLFAEKGTLGKIGTIFGMMLSGAGSGLTHQPNAMLEIMNKEIERDLEAQKQNQANKQSWYNAALQHEKLQPENAQRWAEAQKAANEADLGKWANTQKGVESMQASSDAANMQTLATMQYLQDNINKMPPGPMRDSAQANLTNVMLPAAMNKIMQRNEETALKKRAIDATSPLPVKKANPPPQANAKTGKNYDVVDQDRYKNLIQKGQFTGFDTRDPNTGDYTAMGPHSAAQAKQEVADLTANRQKYALADSTFKKLLGMPMAGEVPAAGLAGATLGAAGALVASYLGSPGIGAMAGGAGASGGRAIEEAFERDRTSAANALRALVGKDVNVDAFLPSWKDHENPKALAAVHENMANYFKNRDEETRTPTLDQFNLKYPAPNYEFKMPKQTSKSKGVEQPKEAAKPKEKSPVGPSNFYLKPGQQNPFQ